MSDTKPPNDELIADRDPGEAAGRDEDAGQYAYYGRTGGCLVTGNEDGSSTAR